MVIRTPTRRKSSLKLSSLVVKTIKKKIPHRAIRPKWRFCLNLNRSSSRAVPVSIQPTTSTSVVSAPRASSFARRSADTYQRLTRAKAKHTTTRRVCVSCARWKENSTSRHLVSTTASRRNLWTCLVSKTPRKNCTNLYLNQQVTICNKTVLSP